MIHYFTFGQNHTHPDTGESMRDYWVEIDADTMGEATEIMVKKYGYQWSMHYLPNEFEDKFFPNRCYETLNKNSEIQGKHLDKLFEEKLKQLSNE